MTNFNTCRLCNLIADGYEDPTVGEIDATLGDFRASSCKTCQGVVYAIDTLASRKRLNDKEHWVPGIRPDENEKIQFSRQREDPTGEGFGLGAAAQLFGVRIIGRVPVPGDDPAVLVHDPLIDKARIRNWLMECDEGHAGACHSILDPWSKLESAKDMLFIDVERRCLTRHTGSCRYIALSYCWGTPTENIFQTTRATVDALLRDGALERSPDGLHLPQTIQDSIAVARLIDVKYLWVDRFCIVQDDMKHKSAQLQNMASIYANAYLTIAACEGADGNFGLLGIQLPRSKPYLELNFSPSLCVTSDQPTRALHSVDDYEPYFSRAWCFQEWVLSPRVLIFHHNTVSWRCHKKFVQENGYAVAHTVMPKSFLASGQILTRRPNIKTYGEMIKEYGRRRITFQEDTLNAFGAIISGMGRAMPGGILFGLPEMCFAGALLWRMDIGCERRKGQDGRILRGFPSWSWVGWQGVANLQWWPMVYPYIDNSQGRPISTSILANMTSCVKMWKTNTQTKIADLIEDSYYDKASWDTEIARPEQDPVHLPVPLVEADIPPEPLFTPYSPILSFHTTRISLTMSSQSTIEDLFSYKNSEGGHTRQFLVHAQSSRTVGLLETHCSEPEGLGGTLCSLIAISRMTLRGDLAPEAKYAHPNCDVPCHYPIYSRHRARGNCKIDFSWEYECVNVLWVEYDEQGIAYRKSVGRVFASFWDSEEAGREEVDVRLG